MNKNAIVCLSRGYHSLNEYSTLISRTNSIISNILVKMNDKIDMLIFHEGNILPEHQEYITHKTNGSNIIFLDVKKIHPRISFDDSKNKLNNLLCPPTRLSSSFHLGYKHMCQFWSIDFLYYLKEYKYIMRIDEDCIITQFNINIFNYMEKEKVVYAAPSFQGQDNIEVIVGMDKLWENFIIKNKIKPIKKFKDIKCPQTAVMILDVDYFNNDDVIKGMLNEIDNSCGIYSNRWGDLPIWGMILSTLCEESKYKEIKEISYNHISWRKKIN